MSTSRQSSRTWLVVESILTLLVAASLVTPSGDPDAGGRVRGAVLEQPTAGHAAPRHESEATRTGLPSDAAAPLQPPHGEGQTEPGPERSSVAPAPFGTGRDRTGLPSGGTAPLSGTEPTSVGATTDVDAPLGGRVQLSDEEPPPTDPRKVRIVRIDAVVGPVFRIRRVDTMTLLGLELGRRHGFSATFHTTVIVARDRFRVRVLDFPIGFGAVARGRLRNGLYGSVGLSAGILVHRAAVADRVIHRVDPDFRLPIGFGWAANHVGLSMAVIQGYSVRDRTYEQRGATIWRRHAYRIGLVLGLHFDIDAPRKRDRVSRGTVNR